jgi:hypothetical protein
LLFSLPFSHMFLPSSSFFKTFFDWVWFQLISCTLFFGGGSRTFLYLSYSMIRQAVIYITSYFYDSFFSTS